MKKLLGIQFRSDAVSLEQEQSCIKKQVGEVAGIDFVSSLDETVGWENPEKIVENYEGIILGGSGEFDFDGNRNENDPNRIISHTIFKRMTPFLDVVFAEDIPTFAICYGHQLLGAYAGVRIVSDSTQMKTGTYSVSKETIANYDSLFSDLPETVLAQYGHKDVLAQVPDNAVLLMTGGDKCKTSALRYGENIYTVQFHPELTAADMIARLKNSPDYLPEGVSAEELIKDDVAVNTLLTNFIERIVSS